MSAARAARSKSAASRAHPADGYTIDIGQWDTHVGSIIYKLNYDLGKDFEPVSLISVNPQLLVARKNLPANTLPELVALMKKDPGKVTFVNQNAAAHVSGIRCSSRPRTEVTFIPYRGAAPAMTACVLGQVDLLVIQGAARCRRCAPARSRRSPTSRRSARLDAGYSDFRRGWRAGLTCRAGSASWRPGARRRRRSTSSTARCVQVLADPAIKSSFTELGLDVAAPAQQTPEGLAAFQKAEIEKWWPIIKAVGVKAE